MLSLGIVYCTQYSIEFDTYEEAFCAKMYKRSNFHIINLFQSQLQYIGIVVSISLLIQIYLNMKIQQHTSIRTIRDQQFEFFLFSWQYPLSTMIFCLSFASICFFNATNSSWI